MYRDAMEQFIDNSGRKSTPRGERRRNADLGQALVEAESALFSLALDIRWELDGRDRLAQLSEAILEVESVRDGRKQPKLVMGDAALCVREQCDLLAPLFAERGVSLRVALPQTLYHPFDCWIIGRLLLYLLFTASRLRLNGDSITLALVKSADAMRLVAVCPGLYDTTHGLELWLMRQLARAHGGDAEAYMDETENVSFCITLR